MKLRPTYLVLVVAGILAVGVLLQARVSRTETYSTANPYGSQGQAEANPGTYAAEYSGPDHLTTNGNNLKVTKAWANPIQSKDEGAIEWTQTNGTEVVFDGRTAGNGCLYDVQGVYLGPGPGNAIWHSAFGNRSPSEPGIRLEVNDDGPDDNYIVMGAEGGTLQVSIVNPASGMTYDVTLACTGNSDGSVALATTTLRFTNDAPQTVNLTGLKCGGVKITADGNGLKKAAVDATVVPAIIEADVVDQPPSGSSYASGIDNSTLVVKLNGKQVSPTLTTITNGFHLYYIPDPSEVREGTTNTVSVSVKDYATNETSPDPFTWTFEY